MTDSVPKDQATPPAADGSRNRADNGISQDDRYDPLIHQGKSNVHHDPGASQDQREHGCEEQPVSPFAPSSNSASQAEEREHRRAERRHWKWSIITGAGSAIATLGAVFFAWSALNASWQAVQAARDQARIAENALIASNRPWIKVTEITIQRVEVEHDSVTVAMDVGVKNVGASPAARTFIRTKLLPDGSIVDKGREAETMCREAVANGYPPFEALVFPNEPHSFFETATAGMRLFRNDRTDRIRETYEANRPIFGEGFARTHKSEDEAVPLSTGLTLVGCAVYVIPVGSYAGQTAFIYSLNHVCDDVPRGTCTFDLTKPAVYTDNAIIVREPVGGTFAR